MLQSKRLRLTASVVLYICFVIQAQGADKYTDENRPYEFGFKIDGQQHRHESKDKDGIIMGEFGFVTADDVYHVTVYATDKEGRFKILSMKNIHLKSSPEAKTGPPTSARQGHALTLPPPQPASVQASVVPQAPAPAPAPQAVPAPTPKPFKPISLQPPGGSCSSCSLPTTTTKAPQPAYNPMTNNNNYPNQFSQPGQTPQNQQPVPPSSTGPQNQVQGGISGSPYTPQRGQQNDHSIPQSIPQQDLVAPYNPPSLTSQSGQPAQNDRSSPSYSQGPTALNGPSNYEQSGGAFPIPGQNQAQSEPLPGPLQPSVGGQKPLPSGGNNPYVGLRSSVGGQKPIPSGSDSPYAGAAPSVSANSVPSVGRQNNFQQAPLPGPNTQAGSQPQGVAGERTAKQYVGPEQQYETKSPNNPQAPSSAQGGQQNYGKPMLVSAQMQIVDKDTDIHALRPGEQRGLPPGITQDDMSQLLYTFNYTVGFHGHFEEGYTNGAKKGYYFVTGRNGVRTRIDYTADDTGFHPKVSQEVLDLLSDEVPKPETEKDEKYGLKGYEFKWLYYPVGSKRR